MSTTYDYNFISRVNRAYSLYPDKFKTIVKDTINNGTTFQQAYLCGLVDYLYNKGNVDVPKPFPVKLDELIKPDMVADGYSNASPIREFLKYNVFVTKVGWP